MPSDAQGVPQADTFQWLCQVARINTAVKLAQLSSGRQAPRSAINRGVRAREDNLIAQSTILT
jgi:hypothetical protein